MKLLAKIALVNLFCFTITAHADDPNNSNYNNSMSDLTTYLKNLGLYLGYDLTGDIAKPPSSPNQQLLNLSWSTITQNYAFNAFLGALPVTAIPPLNQLIPMTDSYLNTLANNTFKAYGSTSGGAGQATITPSSAVDQPTTSSSSQSGGSGSYLPDPVSQSIYNILATPDYSYCLDNSGNTAISNCPYMTQNDVMANVIGPLPEPKQFFTYQYLQNFIGQLNSNTLTGPLLYSTQGGAPSTGSSIPGQQNNGLSAQSQAQQAANFIRYATGAVAPAALPKYSDYSKMYLSAIASPSSPNFNLPQQIQAESTLNNYFTNLRVFTAQTSVAVSNLYYILSKRLPQSQGTNNSNPTSQALSEFNMATWRLFNPANSTTPNDQWIDQINNGSSASVQKEIAILLAEMNYQMYLDRQIQERILMTNSIMLMQNLRAGQPSADFSSQGAGN